jgi:hypothetical protein
VVNYRRVAETDVRSIRSFSQFLYANLISEEQCSAELYRGAVEVLYNLLVSFVLSVSITSVSLTKLVLITELSTVRTLATLNALTMPF